MQDRTLEVQVSPLETEDLASPHSHHCCKKKGRPHRLDAPEFAQDSRDLGGLQNRRFDRPLPHLPHIGDGVVWVQFITHGVPEGSSEHLPNLGFCAVGFANERSQSSTVTALID